MTSQAEDDRDHLFFEKERDRLIAEITTGFETLLLSSNSLNRKLEEVLGMTREYDTIASLWQSFHDLMRGQKSGIIDDTTGPLTEERLQGLPGTGSHVLGMTNKE